MLGDVLLLTDAQSAREESALFARRLAERGVSTRILAVGATNAPVPLDVVEASGLARPWSRAWTARGFRKRAEFKNSVFLHVLQTEWSTPAIALAESLGIPYLLNVDEFPAPNARIRLSRRWCRGLIAPCVDLAAELREGLPDVPVSVIPPAFHVPEPIARDDSNHRVHVVGAAGPLTECSGMATFLEAARILTDEGSDAEFIIAGEGPDELELRRLAEYLGIVHRVTFTEEYKPDAPFWSVLDVFCQTSTRPTSARALAIALAHAVPSITTAVSGARAPHHCLGGTCPAADPRAFALGVRELLADPLRARLIGQAGRSWALTAFDPNRQADSVVALYRLALDDRGIPNSHLSNFVSSTLA